MDNIHILSENIVNQIAAGEVVERPAHLIKELVENSIDANADQIVISVSDSGRNVTVKDNGSGISKENLSIALDRHTTSKINKIDDLWNLNSFGFRGEALASISSVSHLTLTSKKQEEAKSYFLESNFGKKTIPLERPIDQGTEIKISSLFENLPARLKFLKSSQAEYSQIKNLIKAIALAHPKIEFKLIIESAVSLYYNRAENLLARAKQVYEIDKLFLAESKNEKYQVSIVYADPHFINKTSKNIYTFVQNRWVNDKSIVAAVMEAFRNTLMHGEYPYCAVFIVADPQLVDINIHPTKSQVKFINPAELFRVVHHTLRQEIEKAPWLLQQAQNAFLHVDSTDAVKPNNLLSQDLEDQKKSFLNTNESSFNSYNQVQFKQKNFFVREPMNSTYGFDSNKKNEQLTNSDLSSELGYWTSLQVLAQAHLTYIITQASDGLVIIDQHAAHERVVFETLMRQFKNKKIEVQSFLMPLVIDLDPEKVDCILENKAIFAELGIELDSLGPSSIAINSSPVIIKDSALSAAVLQLAEKLIENSFSFTLDSVIGDIFASMACHSAIRAGQALSHPEMLALLKSMNEFPLSSFCPHGRPVSIKITQFQLEKDFGRLL